MPASWAASIQPRKPTPVVAITMSGGAAISARVVASSAWSSTCDRIVRAGARSTTAPCRSSAACSSLERRSAAITMRHPVSAENPWGPGVMP